MASRLRRRGSWMPVAVSLPAAAYYHYGTEGVFESRFFPQLWQRPAFWQAWPAMLNRVAGWHLMLAALAGAVLADRIRQGVRAWAGPDRVCVAGDVTGRGFACRSCAENRLRHLTLAGLATALAALANPLGPGIFGYLRSMLGNVPLQRWFVEWQPPTIDSGVGSTGFWFYLMLLLLAFLMARTPRRASTIELLCYCGLAWLTIGGERYAMWFGLLLSPLLAQQIGALFRTRAPLAKQWGVHAGVPARGGGGDGGGSAMVYARALPGREWEPLRRRGRPVPYAARQQYAGRGNELPGSRRTRSTGISGPT